MKLQQSLAATLLVLAAIVGNAESTATPIGGTRDKPAPAAATSSDVAAPNRADDPVADSAEGAAAEATAKAWSAYQRSVVDALSHSPNPRDWALAALMPDHEAGMPGMHARELVRRALALAGDDRLVLWIATIVDRRVDGAPNAAAQQQLRAIEAENAAVWLADLNAAAARKDEDAVGTALVRMAGSATFDAHYAEIAQAAADAYRRYPAPPEVVEATSRNASPSSEAVAITSAMAVAAATALPGFQHLVNACRVGAPGGRNLARRDDCGAVGRLLMQHSDTVAASRIGMSVLRLSKSYDAGDLQAARNLDWIYEQYLSTLPAGEGAQASEWVTAYHNDWVESASEIEAMRRAVVRAGISPIAADDWRDTGSIFSEERLRQDQARLEPASARN